MAITKQQKQTALTELETIVAHNPIIFLVDFSRAKTLDVTEFRKKLMALDAGYRMVKKTLVKRVFDAHGLAFPNWETYAGSFGIVYAQQNEIDVAKAVRSFVSATANKVKVKNSLAVLGGFMDALFIGTSKVTMLAQIPSREVLIGQLVNAIASPLSGLVYALQYNLAHFVMTVKAIEGSKK